MSAEIGELLFKSMISITYRQNFDNSWQMVSMGAIALKESFFIIGMKFLRGTIQFK